MDEKVPFSCEAGLCLWRHQKVNEAASSKPCASWTKCSISGIQIQVDNYEANANGKQMKEITLDG